MSGSRGRDRGALVALAMGLGSIVILCLIENIPGRITDGFNPWDEGYAQWWMMIISAVSSCISAVALLLLLRTWTETQRTAAAAICGLEISRRANTISQTIGNAQTRAYVGVDRAWAFERDNDVELRVSIKNFGLSPARNVAVFTTLCRSIIGDDNGRTEAKCEIHRFGIIDPGGTAIAFVRGWKPLAVEDIRSVDTAKVLLDTRIFYKDSYEKSYLRGADYTLHRRGHLNDTEVLFYLVGGSSFERAKERKFEGPY